MIKKVCCSSLLCVGNSSLTLPPYEPRQRDEPTPTGVAVQSVDTAPNPARRGGDTAG